MTFTANHVRISRLGDDGKPIQVDVVDVAGFTFSRIGEAAEHYADVMTEALQATRSMTITLHTTRHGRRFFERLLGRGGPWKAAHARRYQRRRR